MSPPLDNVLPGSCYSADLETGVPDTAVTYLMAKAFAGEPMAPGPCIGLLAKNIS